MMILLLIAAIGCGVLIGRATANWPPTNEPGDAPTIAVAPWRGVPVVQMRSASKGTNPGEFWESGVTYDSWGEPYAKAHDSKRIRLFPGGKTGDARLYGTEWVHVRGPALRFGAAHNAHPDGTESGTCRPMSQDVE